MIFVLGACLSLVVWVAVPTFALFASSLPGGLELLRRGFTPDEIEGLFRDAGLRFAEVYPRWWALRVQAWISKYPLRTLLVLTPGFVWTLLWPLWLAQNLTIRRRILDRLASRRWRSQ